LENKNPSGDAGKILDLGKYEVRIDSRNSPEKRKTPPNYP